MCHRVDNNTNEILYGFVDRIGLVQCGFKLCSGGLELLEFCEQYGWQDGRTDGQANGWMIGRMNECLAGCVGGWLVEWLATCVVR
jgi:hypothetical protein